MKKTGVQKNLCTWIIIFNLTWTPEPTLTLSQTLKLTLTLIIGSFSLEVWVDIGQIIKKKSYYCVT